MVFRRFYEDSLAHASYMVGCPGGGEAVVIDPNRDIQQYLVAAAEEGLKIAKVVETHIHADFVSGARDLAEATGAAFLASAEGGADWQYEFPTTALRDGDRFQVGGVRFDVLHTPGHTPEHISLLMSEREGIPLALFSGDFLFAGDVGRPDLLEQAAGISGTMEPGARQLYASLQIIRELPDFVQVLPAHGAGSACGKALGGMPSSTIGYEKAVNWAFNVGSEEEFVREVLQGQPAPPPYFALMKRVNKVEPQLDLGQPSVRLSDVPDGTVVVDVRSVSAYRAAHREGSIFLPLGRLFLKFAGWHLASGQPMVLVAESAEQARVAGAKLSLVGVDGIRGWIAPDQINNPKATAVILQLADAEGTIVDVRADGEWEDGHLGHAVHAPLTTFNPQQFASGCVTIHCAAGTRATIAASLLESVGNRDVRVLAQPVADILAG